MTLTDDILDRAPTVGPAAGDDDYNPYWDEVVSPVTGAPMNYDREGRPISNRDHMRLRMWDAEHGGEYKRVGGTEVGPYWVSTVWLGYDHGFGGVPLIFETMVFNNESGETDVDIMRRYSTEAEAAAGHAEVVERVRLLHEVSDGLER